MSKFKETIPESDDEFSDEFDEEMEDEEEEVEYDELRRRKPAGGFILDEAEVDDELEESESEESGYSEVLRQQSENRQREQEYRDKRKKIFVNLEDEQELEKLIAKYEKPTAEGEASFKAIPKQKPLPGVSNPFLWLIKCTPGEERKTAFLLMRKALAFASKGTPLSIKSVISIDSLKGYLYVEAFKPAHIKTAIADIYSLSYAANSMKMVPIEEMTDVLRVTKPKTDISPNSWVRFKKGLYKDDIALILTSDTIKGYASVKFIPRINYAALGEARAETTAKTRSLPQKSRPIQALFDSDKAQAAGAQMQSEGGFIVCKGRKFKNGFQIKRVPINTLNLFGVVPTMKELEKFGGTVAGGAASANVTQLNETGEEAFETPLQAGNKTENVFVVGDLVKVISGELIDTIGTVRSVFEDGVNIKPKNVELEGEYLVAKHEIQKHFSVGDHVKVITGQFKDESGLVVRIGDDFLVILSDHSVKELRVFPKDIQLCNEKSISYDLSGQYMIHDFVQIDQMTIGVVVSIEQNMVGVLDQYNGLRKIKPQSLTRKRPFSGMFTDRFKNKVFQGDSVCVTDERYKDIRGEFRYFTRGFVFIYSKLITENANMLATRWKNVVLDSASAKFTDFDSSIEVSRATTPGAANRSNSSSYVGIGRSPTISRHNEINDKPKLGSTVRITSGPYKGHIGIVKDATAAVVRVELHSRNKVINVDSKNIKIYTKAAEIGMHGFKSPAVFTGASFERNTNPLATPSHDNVRTPRYGSQTPALDVPATPSHHDEYFGVTETPGNMDDITMTLTDADMTTNFTPGSSVSKIPSLITPSQFPFSGTTSVSDITPFEFSSVFSENITDPSPMNADASAEKPLEKGMVVSISINCMVHEACGRSGVVTGVIPPNIYIVKVLKEDKTFDEDLINFKIERKFLSLKEPEIGDVVKIIQNNLALYGVLMSVDQDNAVVKLNEKSVILSEMDENCTFPLKKLTSFTSDVI